MDIKVDFMAHTYTNYELKCTVCPIEIVRGSRIRCPGTETRKLGFGGEIPRVSCAKCGGRGLITAPKPTSIVWRIVDRFENNPSEFTCGICGGTGNVAAYPRDQVPHVLAEGWSFVREDLLWGRNVPAHWTKTHHEPNQFEMLVVNQWTIELGGS
jgi:hypothetical protein